MSCLVFEALHSAQMARMEYLQQILQESYEIFINQGKKLKLTDKYSEDALALQMNMLNISCMFNLLSEDRVGTLMWLEFDYSENWEQTSQKIFQDWKISLVEDKEGCKYMVGKLLE